MIDVNLGAALWLSQAVAPHMRQRGSGAIVHVTARPALEPTVGMAAYSVSKAALVHLIRVLDVELRQAESGSMRWPPAAGHRHCPRVNVTRIGHEETRRLLVRDNDPARPVPEVTFGDNYTLEVGGERVELAWRGSNHSPDNIYIHFPGHDALMLIDVVNAGWVPIFNTNLSEDVQGYMQAPDIALSYPWSHFICGHLGRLATREDVALHRQYIADIEASAREALASVDPVPYYIHYGENFWAGVRAHLDTVTERAAGPVIAKYTGVLAAADVEEFTMTTSRARSR